MNKSTLRTKKRWQNNFQILLTLWHLLTFWYSWFIPVLIINIGTSSSHGTHPMYVNIPRNLSDSFELGYISHRLKQPHDINLVKTRYSMLFIQIIVTTNSPGLQSNCNINIYGKNKWEIDPINTLIPRTLTIAHKRWTKYKQIYHNCLNYSNHNSYKTQ